MPERVMVCPNPTCNESWVYDGEGVISTAHLAELYQDLDEILLTHLALNSRCWLVVGKMIHQDEFEMTQEAL